MMTQFIDAYLPNRSPDRFSCSEIIIPVLMLTQIYVVIWRHEATIPLFLDDDKEPLFAKLKLKCRHIDEIFGNLKFWNIQWPKCNNPSCNVHSVCWWHIWPPYNINIFRHYKGSPLISGKFQHYSASWWPRRRLKSPASRLFTQSFIRRRSKETSTLIKAPRYWPLCGEFTGDRWIPRTNGQLRGKCFHLMTSSWSKVKWERIMLFNVLHQLLVWLQLWRGP